VHCVKNRDDNMLTDSVCILMRHINYFNKLVTFSVDKFRHSKKECIPSA
jgi:hypothetical protein